MNVPLIDEEKDALQALANQERRNPRDQAALIIRRELERHGLLSPIGSAQSKNLEHANGAA